MTINYQLAGESGRGPLGWPGGMLALQNTLGLSFAGAEVTREDSQRIGQLFQRHGPAVVRRSLRLLGNVADAEEAAQEIFIRALHGAGAFEERSQLTTWLYQITTNYCLNQLRDRARRAELREANPPPPEDEAGAARSDDIALVRRLLAVSDPREAQAAVYVFIDGATHEEAAALLGVSKRTVGNLVERFRVRAREAAEGVAPEAGLSPSAAAGPRNKP